MKVYVKSFAIEKRTPTFKATGLVDEKHKLKTRYPWYWVKNVVTLDMVYDLWMLVTNIQDDVRRFRDPISTPATE
jgi:hypothetical protein